MKAFKKELTMLGVLIALVILTAALNPSSFLDGDNLRNNVRHISLISLFALGQAMVIIAGGIDLSVGSIICLTSVSTSYLTMMQGFGIVPAVIIAIVLAIIIGVGQGDGDRAHRRAAVRRHAGIDVALARRGRSAHGRLGDRVSGEVPHLPVPGRRRRASVCRCRSGSRSARW